MEGLIVCDVITLREEWLTAGDDARKVCRRCAGGDGKEQRRLIGCHVLHTFRQRSRRCGDIHRRFLLGRQIYALKLQIIQRNNPKCDQRGEQKGEENASFHISASFLRKYGIIIAFFQLSCKNYLRRISSPRKCSARQLRLSSRRESTRSV